MTKSILHIDVASVATKAHVLTLNGDGLSLAKSAICPTPAFSEDDGRTDGLGTVLDAIKAQISGNGQSWEPDSVMVTVSAGGEPKAICAGVVKGISGESARRAALVAGATVSDLVCVDDGRQNFERISDLRRQDASVAVLAGGVDEEIMSSGSHQILNMARILSEGLPKKRWSDDRVPVVYAASYEAREEVVRILGDIEIIWADNVRSKLEEENLDSAREAVVGVFSESVRSDPRFRGLGRLGLPEVLPSGHAMGLALEQLHSETGENLMGLSLDGDALQVFSDLKGIFTRTVTPITRVNPGKVARWLPHPALEDKLGDFVQNLILRPWILPASWDELAVFLAFWKGVIREGIEEHRATAIELRGVHRQRQVGETFEVEVAGGDTLVRMPALDRVIMAGTLSHVLLREALVSLVLDGLQPVGITSVYQDLNNALQVAGMLSPGSVRVSESLTPVAVLMSPGEDRDRVGTGWAFAGENGDKQALPVNPGEIKIVPVENASRIDVTLEASRGEDLGEGAGRPTVRKFEPGFSRLYLDGRSRNRLRSLDKVSSRDIIGWYRNLGIFPEDVLSGWAGGRV